MLQVDFIIWSLGSLFTRFVTTGLNGEALCSVHLCLVIIYITTVK